MYFYTIALWAKNSFLGAKLLLFCTGVGSQVDILQGFASSVVCKGVDVLRSRMSGCVTKRLGWFQLSKSGGEAEAAESDLTGLAGGFHQLFLAGWGSHEPARRQKSAAEMQCIAGA